MLPGSWATTDMSWTTLLSTPLARDSRERPRWRLRVVVVVVVVVEQVVEVVVVAEQVVVNGWCTMVPRTLVCHDMQGGYLGDRWEDGCQVADTPWGFQTLPRRTPTTSAPGAPSTPSSTSRTTCSPSRPPAGSRPPGGMVSRCARRHPGFELFLFLQVLGTIITEWEPGRRLLEELLEDAAATATFVAKAVAIAAHHGFHGWLVNIENPVRPDLVRQLARSPFPVTPTCSLARCRRW